MGVIECIVVQEPSEGSGGYKTTVITACNKFNPDTNEILWAEKE